jgi:hypothetical protein
VEEQQHPEEKHLAVEVRYPLLENQGSKSELYKQSPAEEEIMDERILHLSGLD